jgi:hypothetical protein
MEHGVYAKSLRGRSSRKQEGRLERGQEAMGRRREKNNLKLLPDMDTLRILPDRHARGGSQRLKDFKTLDKTMAWPVN